MTSSKLRSTFAMAFGLTLTLISSASAAEQKPQWQMAYGKMKTQGYYSAVSGEFIVDYYDQNLPWGSKVEIHYGFEKSEFRSGALVPVSSWTDGQTEEVSAIEPYKWGKKIVKQLYSRGSSTQLTRLNFYLEITLPSGEKRFAPEGATEGKYFSVLRPLEQEACNPWGEAYCPLSIERRQRAN